MTNSAHPGDQLLQTPGDTDWFVHDRFGLFIHWGLYALPARHEWVQSQEKIPTDVYEQRYFKRFDPDLYDPDRWAELAQRAGMKYFVITTKHHEGFALWDTQQSHFKATHTPYGHDLLGPMVKAFNGRGLRTGFYHSLIDWHHPDYPVDFINHPDRARLAGGTGRVGHSRHELAEPEEKRQDLNANRDMAKYRQFLHAQVRELLTEFEPDILWFDFSFAWHKDHPRDDFRWNKGREAWGSEELYRLVRELRPGVILTDRFDLDMPLSGGDMKTPEQAQPRRWVTIEHKGKQVPVVWEACQTFSGSWGYHRDEQTWRSTRQLIQTLIDCVSKGGNLLLNVGPTGRGEFDHRAVERLEGIGKWMHWHSRSIYGCTQALSEFTTPQDCRLTWNPETSRLYVHLFAWPYKLLHLEGQAFVDRVEYAQLLHDASEVSLKPPSFEAGHSGTDNQTLTLTLPQREPEGVEIPVVELFLK